MLGHMKLVEDDLAICFRHVRSYRSDVRVPHFHGNSLDAADLLRRQGSPESVQAALLAVFGHVHHAPLPQIIHQCQIAVPLPKRLLIHADLAHQLRLPPLQSTLYRPFHDAVDFVPTERQQPGHRFLTGRFQPLDRQQFKQRRESAGRLRPWHLYHPHSVFAAFTSRRLRVQDWSDIGMYRGVAIAAPVGTFETSPLPWRPTRST